MGVGSRIVREGDGAVDGDDSGVAAGVSELVVVGAGEDLAAVAAPEGVLSEMIANLSLSASTTLRFTQLYK